MPKGSTPLGITSLLLSVACSSSLFLFLHPSCSNAQGLPPWNHTYNLSMSTIIMPAHADGYMDASRYLKGWGVIDPDWSNAMEVWEKGHPIDNDRANIEQVRKIRAVAPPETKVWVYRGTAYAYSWYASIRKILTDPDYADWFIDYSPNVTHPKWPKCIDGKCSDAWHAPRGGLYSCPEGGSPCDCGDVPCGFYLFNHASEMKVNGQSFQDWFIYDYMFEGDLDIVDGFYWDDAWQPDGGFPFDHISCELNDTGLGSCNGSTTDHARGLKMGRAYRDNMIALNKYTIEQKKFAWQMMWGHDFLGPGPRISPTDWFSSDLSFSGSIHPIVDKQNCATQLRRMCASESAPPHTRAMAYGLPKTADEYFQHLVNFLLIRGKYAYIGFGWSGPDWTPSGPPIEMLGGEHYQQEWAHDYGEPLGLCKEVKPEVFVRQWTNAEVTMDCNSWEGQIHFKQ